MRSRRAATVAASLGLLGGGAAWTIGPAFADSPATIDDTVPDTADDDTDTTATDDDATTEDEASTDDSVAAATDDADDEAVTARRSWVDEALAPLVEAGMITQEQADAVATALQDARPAREAGRIGSRIGGISISLDTLTETLGVTADELMAAFAEGQSIADVAGAQGVDVQTVVDALVAAATERIDEAVADGRLTEDEAATRLETVTERITELVNQAGGVGTPNHPGRPGGGFPGAGPGGFPGGGQWSQDGGPATPEPPADPADPSGSSETAPADSGTTAPDTAATSDTVADA